MKVFIMFLAFMIVFSASLVYRNDMELYMRMQDSLKRLAEDCAAGGSLATDRDLYASGRLCIDREDAERISSVLIEKAMEKTMFSGGTISQTVKIFDDVKGYDGIEGYGLSAGRPAVAVSLTYSGPDIFRLSFLKIQTVTRTAVYQWEY